MADPATMAMAGAAVGALSNKDDPMKGALMGAALGGGGGYLAGLGGAAAPVGEAALAGTAGETLLTPATMSEFAPIGGAISSPVSAPGVGAIPVLPDLAYQYGAETIGNAPADLSWMNAISPSQEQAIGKGALPGMSGINPLAAMRMGSSALQGAQQQPMRAPGQIKQGNPSGLKYDLIASLLEPKMVERRKLSLL